MFGKTGRNVWAILLLVAIGPLQAAEALKGRANAAAEAVLARFIAGSGSVEWTTESIDVEASLPALAKTARLRAIRRRLPGRQVTYQVLQLTGDRTVKKQVIARYIEAEQRKFDKPTVSVALTGANYKFSYKAAVTRADGLAYVFQIIPRKKREGLIKGELWLDAETAAPLRYSGRLVKSPSMFVKSVEVTRKNSLREGTVEARRTHLTVDTRLIGRAELVIEERPLDAAETMQVTNAGNGGGQP